MTENKLKPCPFCGLQSDTDWEDTLYPSGSGWADEDDMDNITHWCYCTEPKEDK